MSTMSTNLNLELQAPGERASLTVLNANLGKIDDFAGDAMKLTDVKPYALDCNDIDENCVVYVTNSATHSPGAWHILSTIKYDSNNAITQTAISVQTGSIKTRAKSSNGWSEWVPLCEYIELLHTTELTNGTGELYVYRIGKMVHIDFSVNGITDNTIIGYVPTGYGVSQRGCFGALATTGGKSGWLYTTSDRRLSVQVPNLTTSESVFGTCSYYIG